MNISKTNANILTPFSANLFPIKKIISPSFHFCQNAYFNFPLYYGSQQKIMHMIFFVQNI